MPLSWNEIKDRAFRFSKEWAGTANEEADAKPFLVEFFNVFGIKSKKEGSFEHKVKKLDEHDGYIDLLWKGTMLVEMKSRGKDLDKALKQAKEYLPGLKDHELPKYILLSDFENFRLVDLEEDKEVKFNLKDLVKNVQHFGFIAGYQKHTYKEQDPVNIKAALLMGKLHDKLKAIGYDGHPLEVYLVRLLFCLFAEDTTIFDKDLFNDFIEQRTSEDGSDLAGRLSELFHVLNTPKEKRFKNIDEQLNSFPYVNGKLFEEALPPASFDSDMRAILMECCALDWGKISPAIFGSMFQSVMDPTERRNLGAHYTSEKNILKLIKPLFLDELWQEFETVKGSKNKLSEFHKKISTLKFLDPACGCGNFLVITYRELRLLEMEILRAIYKNQQAISIESIIWLNVDMMYGIEFEEFPARIAEVAMWLIDHQMNMAISDEFGQYFVRLPLKKAANIVHGNALHIDWQNLLNPINSIDVYAENANITMVSEDDDIQYGNVNVFAKTVTYEKVDKSTTSDSDIHFDYIMGNPPFIGKHLQNANQKKDMDMIFAGAGSSGVLDYVTCWYLRAARYMKWYNTDTVRTKCAFVSTNSISQGEQAGVLWNELYNKYQIKIHFAHRTFSWSNEAKGNAAVHVVIIGFSNYDITDKRIFEYDNIKGEPHEVKASNINPYLVEGKDFAITTRKQTICNVPEMVKGSQPTDGGNLLLTNQEKVNLIKAEPNAKKFIKPFISAKEFLQNEKRWCLWLVDILPNELKNMPLVLNRIAMVKEMRLKSSKTGTIKWARFPTLFTEDRQPKSNFILIPRHSSENRKFLPIGFFDKNAIVADSCNSIPYATLFHFGVISSTMHMVWIKTTCGRIKSDFRYSNDIVYNNYPWPQDPTEKQIEAIEKAAKKVLDARGQFPDSSLADLYDPLTMPPALSKAHADLDKAVDLAYRPQAFSTEAKRMEFLFELYEKYTADLFTKEKVRKKRKPVRG
jgi:hypothetical protein